jgi:tight adherence protein C
MQMDIVIAGLASPLGLMSLLAAGGVTLVLLTLTRSKIAASDPLDRLRAQARGATGTAKTSLSRQNDSHELLKQLDRFKGMLEPGTEAEKSAARMEMIQAGYHGKTALRDYHAAKFILAVGGLLIGLGYGLLTRPENPSMMQTALPVLIPTLIGYYIPIYWLNKRRQERQDQIARGFPDALDLLIIATGAGQSLDQSISRISRELHAGYPALAEELETVTHEMRAGKDKISVLRDFGERCGNADIRSFATVLIQSTTYGTPVIDALRVYAAEMRDKRVMLAEEKANVLPTKLTLGTMMFTVPPLLIILIGPSVIGVMEMLQTIRVSP